MHTQTKSACKQFKGPGADAARRAQDQRLGTREREVLRFVTEQRIAHIGHLTRHLGVKPMTMERIVSRLEREGYAYQQQFLVGYPAWVWLPWAGARVAGGAFNDYVPKIGMLPQYLMVNELRLKHAEEFPQAHWVSERMLIADSPGITWPPDAVLHVGDERLAIVVELTYRWPKAVVEIVERHLERYDALHYYCSPRTRPLADRAQERGQWDRLYIHDLPEAR